MATLRGKNLYNFVLRYLTATKDAGSIEAMHQLDDLLVQESNKSNIINIYKTWGILKSD